MKGALSIKKLGILGGMGPESTLLYYKKIVPEYKRKDKNGYFPILSIETVNMYEMLGYCKTQHYKKTLKNSGFTLLSRLFKNRG